MTRAIPWAVVAAAVALLYGAGHAGYVGYDSTYALMWGQELAHLDAPSFDSGRTPAPHPLINAIAVALAPLGDDGGRVVMELLGLAALVLLGYAGYRLGAVLFSALAGAIAAGLLLTRPELVWLGLFAQFDLPYLGLVLLAAALVAEEPRRGTAPLVLLTVAGLIRPEAWVLAFAYALWLRRPAMIALAAVAPAVWALHDVVIAGDPFFSFEHTREFAERHQSGNGLGDAIDLAPEFLRGLLGMVVTVGGVLAWVLAPPAAQRRVVLPAALFTVSLATFLALGIAGTTLYSRFLLPAAGALAVLCAAGMAGWDVDPLDRARRAVGIVIAVAVVATLPSKIRDLADVRDKVETRVQLEDELAALVDAHRDLAHACDVVSVPGYRVVPRLRQDLDLPDERFTQHRRPRGALTIVVPPGRDFIVDPIQNDPVLPGTERPPEGSRTIAATENWILAESC